MIRSMTGFGKATAAYDDKTVSIEIKSVNHRYFEMYARTPRSCMQLEDLIRSQLQKKIVRGKIEVNVNISFTGSEDVKISVNKELLKNYLDAFNEISEEFSLKNDVSASIALRIPDALVSETKEMDMDKLWSEVLPVLEEAVDALIDLRTREGGRIAEDIISKCEFIKENVKYIEARSEKLVGEYETKLRNRIIQLLGDTHVDEQRLLTEVAIMADKVAIDEEITRLNSHCAALAEMFESGESNGKKMDFIIQEMNREVNTISSKIGDIDITKKIIELKNCIEKIREQIQNIE
ncbi:MAG: YicC family protein [Clostridia bacterium]|nr:YicC family protein [Clostridia bacterium]